MANEKRIREDRERAVREEKESNEKLKQADAANRSRLETEAEVARAKAQKLVEKLERIEEENRQKEEDKRNYPRPSYLEKTSGKINIGVTGNSGVGKSSLTNAIRGVKSKDPGAAKTDSAECTLEPEMFEFPSGATLDLPGVLWDLPGAGTKKFPQETYMRKMGIRYFDVVILVTADRFTEAEVMLRQELVEFKVPHFCVRNKMDVAWGSRISAEEEEEEEELSDERKQELKHILMLDLARNFKEHCQVEGVYFVSTQPKSRKQFELDKMVRDAKREISNARVEHACPICLDTYADFGGPAGKRSTRASCTHVWCEKCPCSQCPICRVPCSR